MKNENNLPVRLIFQDEARFGRMSDSRACWAPAPLRPMVGLALVREFRYEYAAISPWSGDLDYMTSEKMNTKNMSQFLKQIAEKHEQDFTVMVLDGAPSHRSKELEIPENVALVFLPPYSPELNPVEQLWNRLRRDYFANRVFNSLDAATLQAERGLEHLAANKQALKSLTNWPWINTILNAK
ncbi:MAG: IS630 family transposase [Chloroflexi bacterium]|nr:IS630 family transposase [Chloroflexota bacterium]